MAENFRTFASTKAAAGMVLANLTNERDFPVPSEPRPVRVAVDGN